MSKKDMKISSAKKEGSATQTPFSSLLNICFKGFIVFAAIYASIDYGCWKRTYLEPLENKMKETKLVEESKTSSEMNNSKKYTDKAVTILKKQCKKKTNRLVYADKSKLSLAKCNPTTPKISKTCGTRIRYCTAKELKLMTQSTCECPGAGGPFHLGNAIWGALQNAAKAAAIVAVTYLTYDMGFWGTPHATERTFASICETMPCQKDPCKRYEFKSKNMECEETKELLKIPTQDPCACDDCIPVDLEKCCYKMKQLWNHTVIFIFEGIANAPDNIIDYIKRKLEKATPKDCGPCSPSGDAIQEKNETCHLYDDYDEKYPRDIEEECAQAEAELEEYLEKEDGQSSCDY